MSESGPGRVYRSERTVRLGDVDMDAKIRLDAVARYAQDVASDDVRDVALDGKWGWVVRRTTIVMHSWPRFEEELSVATWCAGVGAAWAERRTTLFARSRPMVDVSGLWVCLDPVERRPVGLDRAFLDVFGPAAARRVPGRLTHPWPPAGLSSRPWGLRRTDYDAFGHVNNAALWAMVVDELGQRHPGLEVSAASVEHRGAIGPGARVVVSGAEDGAGGLGLWLCASDGEVLSSAMIQLRPAGAARS